jgi:hypothetical protein
MHVTLLSSNVSIAVIRCRLIRTLIETDVLQDPVSHAEVEGLVCAANAFKT